MSKEEKYMIDEMLRKGLEGYEVPMQESDWDSMGQLLDNDFDQMIKTKLAAFDVDSNADDWADMEALLDAEPSNNGRKRKAALLALLFFFLSSGLLVCYYTHFNATNKNTVAVLSSTEKNNNRSFSAINEGSGKIRSTEPTEKAKASDSGSQEVELENIDKLGQNVANKKINTDETADLSPTVVASSNPVQKAPQALDNETAQQSIFSHSEDLHDSEDTRNATGKTSNIKPSAFSSLSQGEQAKSAYEFDEFENIESIQRLALPQNNVPSNSTIQEAELTAQGAEMGTLMESKLEQARTKSLELLAYKTAVVLYEAGEESLEDLGYLPLVALPSIAASRPTWSVQAVLSVHHNYFDNQSLAHTGYSGGFSLRKDFRGGMFAFAGMEYSDRSFTSDKIEDPAYIFGDTRSIGITYRQIELPIGFGIQANKKGLFRPYLEMAWVPTVINNETFNFDVNPYSYSNAYSGPQMEDNSGNYLNLSTAAKLDESNTDQGNDFGSSDMSTFLPPEELAAQSVQENTAFQLPQYHQNKVFWTNFRVGLGTELGISQNSFLRLGLNYQTSWKLNELDLRIDPYEVQNHKRKQSIGLQIGWSLQF